ncbi:hypothetical protein [Poseidonibacter ostreae]|uniref:Uncharacterized protein n=1 Tax=Poseidonibacter ostreae TaxID=2654171 RepID=A0A6L4WW64_9BACT|nr:hypothetical protein [Poseidonibacter ostreae]KAB7891276.1 hypothetical protein GBG19_00135 [Poseidonibacter ostreae]
MKIIIISLFFIFNLFSATCFTAVNGFKATTEISTKIQDRSTSTTEKVNDLHTVISLKDEKLKEIAKLEELIRGVKSVTYIKSKAILAHLQALSQIEDNNIVIEQIHSEQKR